MWERIWVNPRVGTYGEREGGEDGRDRKKAGGFTVKRGIGQMYRDIRRIGREWGGQLGFVEGSSWIRRGGRAGIVFAAR